MLSFADDHKGEDDVDMKATRADWATGKQRLQGSQYRGQVLSFLSKFRGC